jgi:tellurium resistance protein TerD
MAISLTKGQNVALDAGLKNVRVALGWKARETEGEDFDLDASCFLLAANGKVRSDHDFIFYGQLKSQCGSVEHTGDNLVGGGEDDETLIVQLDKVPADVQKLVFTVTIYEYDKRKQNFGMVSDAYIRVVDDTTDEEQFKFDLSEDASVNTAMIFGELYRKGGAWKFKAVGQGFNNGLLDLCRTYGVNATA